MNDGKVTLNYATQFPRDEAIQSLEKFCSENRLSILDCRMFSNMSLVLELEGAAGNFVSLNGELIEKMFRIESASQQQIERLAGRDSDYLIHGTLQITFSLADGSLIIPIPSVPG